MCVNIPSYTWMIWEWDLLIPQLEVTNNLWKGHFFTIPKKSRSQNCQVLKTREFYAIDIPHTINHTWTSNFMTFSPHHQWNTSTKKMITGASFPVSGQIMTFHQAGFHWNKGSHFNPFLGHQGSMTHGWLQNGLQWLRLPAWQLIAASVICCTMAACIWLLTAPKAASTCLSARTIKGVHLWGVLSAKVLLLQLAQRGEHHPYSFQSRQNNPHCSHPLSDL